jgi:hypothetical protein
MSVFEGTHPMLTQMPPIVPSSTIATLAPSSAALIAAARAAEPPPIRHQIESGALGSGKLAFALEGPFGVYDSERYPAFATASAKASSEIFASATTAAVPSRQSPTSALSTPGTPLRAWVACRAQPSQVIPSDTQRKMDSLAHETPP